MDNIISKAFTVTKNTWFNLSVKLNKNVMYQTGIIKIFDSKKQSVIYPVTRLPDILFTNKTNAESIEEMDSYRSFNIFFHTFSNTMINIIAADLPIIELKITKSRISEVKKGAGIWKYRKLFSLEHLKYYLDNLYRDYKNEQFLDRFSSDYILYKDPRYFDKYIKKIKTRKYPNRPDEKKNDLSS